MFKNLLILIFFSSFSALSAQTVIEESISEYQSGKIFWKGKMQCELVDSGPSRICVHFGAWDYWYENGQKQLETFLINVGEYKYSPLEKYINMWLPDGKQILKDGNGTYYTSNSSGDSLVYQVKDSLKNGAFQFYKKQKKNKYVLVETGQYLNSKKLRLARDTILIIPGQGIDKIVLQESKRSDVKQYKKIEFESKGPGLGYACGPFGSHRFRSVEYKNDTAGLTFEFRSAYGRAFARFYKVKLEHIHITGAAKTSNGLIIGESHKEEVIRLYGLPADWKNENYIAYYLKGISFRFNKYTGIIEEIEVFKPQQIGI